MASEIDLKVLRELLVCDAEAGTLTWKARPRELFPHGYGFLVWNRRYANKAGFETKNAQGYLCSSIFGKKFQAHRVIWALHYGEWPSLPIDHINGITTDNRISNLRSVSLSENQRNVRLGKNNTSGTCGVTPAKRANKWRAQITVNRKQIHLGTFDLLADAISARKSAEAEHGFHPNHGRTA